MTESRPVPIACTLPAETLARRGHTLLPGLAARATRRVDGVDTMTLEFTPELLTDIAAVIDAERQCCRFLTFDVTVAPDGGPITLTLSGPPGTREFLDALLTSPRESSPPE